MTIPSPAAGSEEPTIDWLIDAICPNPGNSPMLNFNKKRLRDLIAAQNNATYEAVDKLVENLHLKCNTCGRITPFFEADLRNFSAGRCAYCGIEDGKLYISFGGIAELRQNIAKIFGKVASDE